MQCWLQLLASHQLVGFTVSSYQVCPIPSLLQEDPAFPI